MRQFYSNHHKSIVWQALQSGSLLSLFIYGIVRMMFYEFPMTSAEEMLFFIKIFSSSLFVIATATGGSVLLYRSLLKMRSNK